MTQLNGGLSILAAVAASLVAIVGKEAQDLNRLIEEFKESQRAGKPMDAGDIIARVTASKTNLIQATSDAQTAVNDVAREKEAAAKVEKENAGGPLFDGEPITTTLPSPEPTPAPETPAPTPVPVPAPASSPAPTQPAASEPAANVDANANGTNQPPIQQ